MVTKNSVSQALVIISLAALSHSTAFAADLAGKWVFQKFSCAGGETAEPMPFEKYKHEISFDDGAFNASIDQVAKQKGKKVSCHISSKGKFSVEGDQLTMNVEEATAKGAKDCKANKGSITSEFQVQNDELRITVPTGENAHPYCPKSQAVQLYTKTKI